MALCPQNVGMAKFVRLTDTRPKWGGFYFTCEANGACVGFKNPTCSGFGIRSGIRQTRPNPTYIYIYIILNNLLKKKKL